MNYLSVENLSKAFSDKLLFENLSFGIEKGDKTALIAENGTGKTTLMRILVGKEEADGGKVVFNGNVRVGYLEQLPTFDPDCTIGDVVAEGHTDIMRVIRRYEDSLVNRVNLEEAMAEMDANQAWDYEMRLKQLLSTFEINDLSQKIGTLSGGQVKRLALALVLLDNPDILFLDEPTNHLDMQMVEWLEDYLSQSNVTLFMVTHDRYFLDRVCNKILEMYHGVVYTHKGNFDYYVRKSREREENKRIAAEKAGQMVKRELEWIRATPQARTGKSRARIDAFFDLKEKAKMIERIEKEMMEAARNLDFERATELRDIMFELKLGE